MAIEHRCGTRTPLNLDVTIHVPRLGAVAATVRDISIGGMQVEAPVKFSVHQLVTVEFAFPRGGPIQRWNASVTHTTHNGGGLMFDNFKSNELAILMELLQTAEEHARAVALSIPPGFPDSTDPPHAPATRHNAVADAAATTGVKPIQSKLGDRS
jgi:hypothetical protein